MRKKNEFRPWVKITLGTIAAVAFLSVAGLVNHEMNKYSVPATVIGLSIDGDTLFETADGYIWPYHLATYIGKGKKVILNMYDRSPDGRTVKYNTIRSVTVDGVDREEVTEDDWKEN